MDMRLHLKQVVNDGFSVMNNIYTADELTAIQKAIEQSTQEGASFRKTDDLFAIRQFLKEVPQALPLIFNEKLKSVILKVFGDGYFSSKSIYFDKPERSNWFVAWHQDLIITVDARHNTEGYGPWTVKHNQFGVQPPLSILQDNFTIRIHLDDADENNGALKVVPGSHQSICRPENIDWSNKTEVTCPVKAGGIMLMRPLLLHASSRTTNNKRRRVIHIEFSRAVLTGELNWSEKIAI